jgi:fructose-1,6-bisphosphatase/inositol monophosphatase family enzyme
MTKNLYTDELRFAQDVARKAGAIMLRHFRTGISHERKADGTPVTKVDRKVKQFVAQEVKSQRPGEVVLNEEDARHAWGAEQANAVPRRWVCDPIDGTWLYAAGVPNNIFSLALQEHRQPVLGVLFDPYTNSMFHAVVGGNAFLNGKPIHVNTANNISGSCFTLPGGRVDTLDAGALFKDVVDRGADVVTFGSVIYDAALVALGFASAHVYPYTSPWDMAAIKVIVEAAGGRVTDLNGSDQPYDSPINGAIVTNGYIHDRVVKLVGGHIRK